MPVMIYTQEEVDELIAARDKVIVDLARRVTALEKAAVAAPAPAPDPGPAPTPGPTPAPDRDPRILEAPRFADGPVVVGGTYTRVVGRYVAGATPIAGARLRDGVALGDVGARATYTVVAADEGRQMVYVEAVRMPDGTTFPARSEPVVPISAVQLQGRAAIGAE